MDDDDRTTDTGIMGALMAPLRIPQRVVADIEEIAASLRAFQRDAQRHLASVDENAGELVTAVAALREPLERVHERVSELQQLQQAVTLRIDAVQDDLNVRMRAVESEVRAMRSPIEQMARDVATVARVLPEPGDGPFARLRDSLTPS